MNHVRITLAFLMLYAKNNAMFRLENGMKREMNLLKNDAYFASWIDHQQKCFNSFTKYDV